MYLKSLISYKTKTQNEMLSRANNLTIKEELYIFSYIAPFITFFQSKLLITPSLLGVLVSSVSTTNTP